MEYYNSKNEMLANIILKYCFKIQTNSKDNTVTINTTSNLVNNEYENLITEYENLNISSMKDEEIIIKFEGIIKGTKLG